MNLQSKDRKGFFMLDVFIKYFFISVFTIKIYYKLLNLTKPPSKTLFSYFLSAISISFLITYIRPFQEYFSLTFSFITLLIFITIKSKIHYKLAFTAYIISYVFNYSISSLSYLLSILLIYPFDKELKTKPIYLFLISSIIEFLFLLRIFKIKALSKGMPFLLNKFSNTIGIWLSLFILFFAVILNNGGETDKVYIIFTVLLSFSTFFILKWWKAGLKKLYIEHLKEAELIRLNEQIEQQNAKISLLEDNNKYLAAIIHKDNKLIPAMELAVKELLLYYANNHEDATRVRLLLNDLQIMSHERSGIIHTYDSIHKTLPSTGMTSTDSILLYMSRRALQFQIQFDLSILGNIKQICKNTINSEDLNTIIADLIDNSIIATKGINTGKILVHMGIINSLFQICCFDNGIPFKQETLLNLGTIPSTTHATEGGSGIGYMTIFKIKSQYKASLIIESFFDNTLYTKKVSLVFDKQEKYIVK